MTSATTLAEAPEAATLLVLGDGSKRRRHHHSRRRAISDGEIAGVPRRHRRLCPDDGGLDDVDLWIGGLAEAKNEFGGMLGSTFNFIFEYQMEHLQNGDRFYYLSRTQGMNLLNQLEPNTFADIVMRNSDLGDDYATHLNGAADS